MEGFRNGWLSLQGDILSEIYECRKTKKSGELRKSYIRAQTTELVDWNLIGITKVMPKNSTWKYPQALTMKPKSSESSRVELSTAS